MNIINADIDLRTLRFFLDVYQLQSFSAVARRHNLSIPVITRSINQLETLLKQPLFYRNTRSVQPTDAGHLFANYATEMLNQFERSTQALNDLNKMPSGTVRIHSPVVFGQKHIAPWLGGLLARYPQLNVELIQQDEAVDFHRERIDLAFRIDALPNSSLKVRTFALQHYYLAASPDYLAQKGTPENLDALAEHHCLMYKGASGLHLWHFCKKEKDWETPILTPKIASNNVESLVTAALHHSGIVLFPDWLIGEHIQQGNLVPILTDYQVATNPQEQYVSAVYPNTAQPSRNIRVVLDYFVEVFGERAYWLV